MAGLDSNVKLLLHFNGTNGQTTTTDSSDSAHTVTMAGTAQLDTTTKKFGTAALSLDGDSDYITIPDHDDFYFSTGIFTFECWVYLIDTGAGQYLYSHDLTTDPSRINLVLDMPVVGGLTRFQTTIKNAGVAETQNLTAGATITYNTWHHIAIVSDGTNIKHYVDGNLHTTLAIVPNSFINLDSDIIIGAHPANILHVRGFMDEVRISNVARWTAPFTPPTEEYGVFVPSTSRHQIIIIT